MNFFLLTLFATAVVAQYRQSYSQQGSYGGDSCCEEYCYAEDEEPYRYFATKTAYHSVFGKRSNIHVVPQCRPIQFWSINRHGARLPGAQTMERLQQLEKIRNETVKNYQERGYYPDRGRFCNRDLSLFVSWRWNYTLTRDRAKQLTTQGANDLKYIAKRYQTRFRELLGLEYSPNHYKFQYTDTDRTYDSYQAYISGLFLNYDRAHADVTHEDPLLKQYKNCDTWQREVQDNPAVLAEYYKFKERPEFKQLVRNVFQRLGFRYSLNDSVVQDMYDMCRFERAWYPDHPSTWCAAFTKDQLKMLEYLEDLKHYYTSGYGHELNARLGCPPLKDMYERFEKTVNGATNEPKVITYFAHSKSIQLLLVAMGIAKDYTPLTAENYYQQTRRLWRTSLNVPFAANLVAVLYQCEQGDRHRVMFFLNENPVDFPGCQVGLCSWQAFKEKVQNAAETCNLDFCYGGVSAIQSNFILLILGIFSLILYKINT